MPNHDESTNYLRYPTLMPLPSQADQEARQIQRLQAERETYTAELERIQAELTRIEAEIQRLEEKQRQRKEAERKARLKNRNILGYVGDFYSRLSLDGITPKESVTELCFLDALANAPGDAADLSEAKDGSVLCWTEGTVQYIAGEGGVAGGKSCADLFAGYKNVTAIHFNGSFDTSRVTNMSGMFSGCTYLRELDLSDWDTSSVIYMSEIFNNCHALRALNLSGWDTSHVTSMIGVFCGCWALHTLDLSGWDTSSVTHMGWMFCDCRGLTTLNLSGWDTSNVRNMRSMFEDCDALTDFDRSQLDTSHANTRDMFSRKRQET